MFNVVINIYLQCMCQDDNTPAPTDPPVNTGLPVITGGPGIGSTLTGTDGTWSGFPTSFTRQWKRDGVNIPGATSSVYSAVADDAGTDITFEVTAINDLGSTPAASDPLAMTDFSAFTKIVFGRMSPAFTSEEKIGSYEFIDDILATGKVAVFQLRDCVAGANDFVDWCGVANAVNHGSTKTPGKGRTVNGVDQYIDTGFKPSTMGSTFFTQNSARLGGIVVENLSPSTASLTAWGCFGSSTRRLGIIQTGTGVSYRMNCASAITTTSDDHIHGGSLYSISRSISTTIALSLNGSSYDSGAQTSNGLPDQNVFEGVNNNAGTAQALTWFNGSFYCFFVAGPGYDGAQFKAAITKMIIKRNGGLLAWMQLGVEMAGQSNEEGETNGVAPSTQALRDPIPNALVRFSGYPTLQYGVNNSGNLFGPELTLAKKLTEDIGGVVYFGKTVAVGAPVHADPSKIDFNFATVGEKYEDLKNGLISLRNVIHTIEKFPVIVLDINQGEAELDSLQHAQDYTQNWTDVFNGIQSTSAVDYYIICRLTDAVLVGGVNPAFVAALQTSQDNLVTNTRNAFQQNLQPYALRDDHVHFSAASQEQIGIDKATIIETSILLM